MIDHIIFFWEIEYPSHDYTWHLKLPYRLVLGDFLNVNLLLEKGELQYNKVIDDDFFRLLDYEDHLFVERLEIDNNGHICVWLTNQP